MALELTPLDQGSLSPAAQKALGPGPMKMMAARGLAPLPRPGDLISVLYQLTHDADAKIKAAAAKSAADLPEKVLTGALADESLDPRVLDFFASKVAGNDQLIELVILNKATADDTVAWLAGKLGEMLIELISGNQERLLRCPAIIGAMYMNRSARMSTVDRAVELAVRNDIKVPGIPAWNEVVQAVLGGGPAEPETSAAVDELFAQAAKSVTDGDAEAKKEGRPPRANTKDDGEIPINEMTMPMKIRLAMMGNQFARGQLIRDTNKLVAMAAIKAPSVSDLEAAKYAANAGLHEEVMAYIASRRDWTKLYGVKLALVQNPKTPLAAAMRLLPHLRTKDKRVISRSKGIPSALAAQAKKLMTNAGAKKR